VSRFGAKLDLLMKLRNLSRARLASEVGIDKSVVSRWLGDAVRPSDHNLTRLTELIRRDLPEFSLLTWEFGYDEFAAAVGAPGRTRPKKADQVVRAGASSLPLDVLPVSRTAVPREGRVYPGLYLGFRKAFANTGMTIAKGLMIRRDGDRLLADAADGSFDYRGEVLLLGGQVFIVLEEATRLDEVVLLVLNGVTSPMARIMDGVMLGIAADRTGTPSATAIVFKRVGDTTGVAAGDEARWSEFKAEVRRINDERTARIWMPCEFADIIDNQVGVPRADGQVDHVLRVPHTRSLTASTSEANWRP
jgi:transcriptional regulator with XRE-family HTH domain